MITYDLGDGVPLEHLVRDADGCPADATVTLVLTAPDGSHPAVVVDHPSTGVYTSTPVPAQLGDWSGQWQVTGGITDLVYFRFRIVDPAVENVVTLAQVKTYLGATTATDAQIQDALDAEAENQGKVCNIPEPYPRDLRQALKRRVARNLAMQRIPLAVLQGDVETGGSTIPPGSDPEIRRLEKPYLWILIA